MNTHGEPSPVLIPAKLAVEVAPALSLAAQGDFPVIPDHELLRRIGEGLGGI
jgi:hypothetical protein